MCWPVVLFLLMLPLSMHACCCRTIECMSRPCVRQAVLACLLLHPDLTGLLMLGWLWLADYLVPLLQVRVWLLLPLPLSHPRHRCGGPHNCTSAWLLFVLLLKKRSQLLLVTCLTPKQVWHRWKQGVAVCCLICCMLLLEFQCSRAHRCLSLAASYTWICTNEDQGMLTGCQGGSRHGTPLAESQHAQHTKDSCHFCLLLRT